MGAQHHTPNDRLSIRERSISWSLLTRSRHDGAAAIPIFARRFSVNIWDWAIAQMSTSALTYSAFIVQTDGAFGGFNCEQWVLMEIEPTHGGWPRKKVTSLFVQANHHGLRFRRQVCLEWKKANITANNERKPNRDVPTVSRTSYTLTISIFFSSFFWKSSGKNHNCLSLIFSVVVCLRMVHNWIYLASRSTMVPTCENNQWFCFRVWRKQSFRRNNFSSK